LVLRQLAAPDQVLRMPLLGADKVQKLSDKIVALKSVKNVNELRPLLRLG